MEKVEKPHLSTSQLLLSGLQWHILEKHVQKFQPRSSSRPRRLDECFASMIYCGNWESVDKSTKVNGSSSDNFPRSSAHDLLALSVPGHVKKAIRDEETPSAVNSEGGGEKPHDSRGQIQIYSWSLSEIGS
ncbi:hypothetical protein Bca4012_035740 [Brassica carinata]